AWKPAIPLPIGAASWAARQPPIVNLQLPRAILLDWDKTGDCPMPGPDKGVLATATASPRQQRRRRVHDNLATEHQVVIAGVFSVMMADAANTRHEQHP